MSSGEYPEELVELVTLALYDSSSDDYQDYARSVLDALSSAGRLVPPDGPPRACGCPRVYRVGLDPAHRDGCEIIERQRKKSAELAAWRAEVDRLATPWTPAESAQRSEEGK